MYFRFKYNRVMKYYRQDASKHKDGRIHPSQTITQKHRKLFGLEDGDEMLVLVYTNERSLITKKQIRVAGPEEDKNKPNNSREYSSDFALTKKEIDVLDIEEGDVIHRWFTPIENIADVDNPETFPQQSLPDTNVNLDFLDPTQGTWLHIRDQELASRKGSDGTDGNVSIRKRSPPYRKYLELPTDDPVTIRAEYNGNVVEFERELNKNATSFTIPIEQRRELGVEAGDVVRVFISTTSITEILSPEETTTPETSDVTGEIGSEPAKEWERQFPDIPRAKSAAETAEPSTEVNGGDVESEASGVTNVYEEDMTDSSDNDGGDVGLDDVDVRADHGVDSAESEVAGGGDMSDSMDGDDEVRDETLVPVLLESERQEKEWAIHYTTTLELDGDTVVMTLCKNESETVYTENVASFGTTQCDHCAKWAALSGSINPEKLEELHDIVSENGEVHVSSDVIDAL